MLAPPAPVTYPTDAEAGRPSSCFNHEPATSSNASDAGESAPLKAFWSQPEVSRSATSAASSEPPTTKPKYRGPADPMRPGAADATSSSITVSMGVGPAGSVGSRCDATASRVDTGPTRASAAFRR